MPLTSFQREVLQLLAANRSPESHIGGGAVINRSNQSPRFSADLDMFHDSAETVYASAQADTEVLTEQGFEVEWLLRQPFIQRAQIKRGGSELRLDWCYDSAFRFFPVQSDPEFGYCLHPVDIALNKTLALAGRSEIRDYLDILYLDKQNLSLGALCWAACGKDQGFTPLSLLDFARRNMKFRDEDLAGEHLVQPVTLLEIKDEWVKTAKCAEDWIERMPSEQVGCLFLAPDLNPITPDPDHSEFAQATRHYGSLQGAWPRLS